MCGLMSHHFGLPLRYISFLFLFFVFTLLFLFSGLQLQFFIILFLLLSISLLCSYFLYASFFSLPTSLVFNLGNVLSAINLSVYFLISSFNIYILNILLQIFKHYQFLCELFSLKIFSPEILLASLLLIIFTSVLLASLCLFSVVCVLFILCCLICVHDSLCCWVLLLKIT